MYAVILAGGGGTRLWPLSRPDRPKPFLPLLGDESLIQRTVRRLDQLVAPEDIYVVTDRRYGAFVRQQLPDVRLLVEPSGRNTAPAIALATDAIERPDEEVMVVLPADHHIRDEPLFAAILQQAVHDLAEGMPFDIEAPLVTLGVQPTRPATEYGYIRPRYNDGRKFGGLWAYPVEDFEEKPERPRAEELFNSGGVAWNAGMFMWRRGSIRAALEKYTGLLMLISAAAGSDFALTAAYDRMKAISVDHAVLEGAARDGRVVMGAMDVGWSDLGTWTSLVRALAGEMGEAEAAATAVGRVLESGESVEIGPNDLLVGVVDGRLRLVAAEPGTIVPDGPSALLTDARPLEAAIEGLLERVESLERSA
jgi:mannose-1-phosphate guanylyltransferase